jgi:hypothetical protein
VPSYRVMHGARYSCLQSNSHDSTHAHSSEVDNRSPKCQRNQCASPAVELGSSQHASPQPLSQRRRHNPRFLCLLCSRIANNYGAVCVCAVMTIVLQAAVI